MALCLWRWINKGLSTAACVTQLSTQGTSVQAWQKGSRGLYSQEITRVDGHCGYRSDIHSNALGLLL
jgi:hypothetical protein